MSIVLPQDAKRTNLSYFEGATGFSSADYFMAGTGMGKSHPQSSAYNLQVNIFNPNNQTICGSKDFFY